MVAAARSVRPLRRADMLDETVGLVEDPPGYDDFTF